MVRRRRWDPAKHPRDRIGRFADRVGGGWLPAVSTQLGERTGHATRMGDLDITVLDHPPVPPDIYLEAYKKVVRNSYLEYKQVPLRTLQTGELVRVRDPQSNFTEWAFVNGWGHSGDEVYVDVVLPDGRFLRVQSHTGGNEHVQTKRKPVYDPLAPTTGDRAKQMNRWRKDANRQVRISHVQTNRQLNYPRFERELREAQEHLERQRGWLERDTDEVEQLARRFGYRGQRRREYIDNVLGEKRKAVARAETDVRLAEQAREYNRTANDPALEDKQTVGHSLDPSAYNPNRPLAVYGDMLKIGGGDAVYTHLAELSEIPAPYHLVVARHMAGWEFGEAVVSSKSVAGVGFDPSDPPRGWHEGAVWDDVDGAYNPGTRTFYVGYTDNTQGQGLSAAKHEFGHALDDALGSKRTSAHPQWIEIWEGAVHHANGLSPYFRQQKPAGPQELWAEAFDLYISEKDTDSRVVAVVDKLFHERLGSTRALATARSLVDYFDQIAEEVTQHVH
jgi:hypothetical protein